MTTTSVIIPCYDHRDYVAQALEAVFAQTRQPDEVIVIDDFSSDDSLRVIEEMTKSRSNAVIVRRSERGGAVRGMNQGLALAKGKFVALLASDDFVSPKFLEHSVRMLEQHPEAAFCSASVELRTNEGMVVGQRPVLRPSLSARYISGPEVSSLLEKGDNFFLGAATVYRKSCLMDLGGFDDKLGSASDGLMQRRLAVRRGICFLPQVLAVWRIHGNNYSTASVTNVEALESLIKAVTHVIHSEPEGIFPPEYAELFGRRLRFNASRLLAADVSRRPETVEALSRCVEAGPVDSSILALLRHAGPLAPTLVTAWLTLRLHPFSYRWLAQEWLLRLLQPRTNEMAR